MKHRTIILPIGGSGGSEPQPSGTITINREGIYDVTSYASAKVEIPNPVEQPNYLYFTANGSGSVGFHVDTSASKIPYLEYSFDTKNWNVWDFSDISLEDSEEVFFRGINRSGLSNNNNARFNNYFTTSDNASFDVSGDISTLIDYTNDTIIPGDYAFSRLFYGTKVMNASGLILPYDTVGPYWYQYMFATCVMLDSAPALPATTLAQSCYQGMFQGCIVLTTAPALPATTLAQNCYYSMFQGCIVLTTAPALPATTLAQNCYQEMFRNCTSLENAPALPATTLAQNCYYSMFQGCTALVSTPALPATTLDQSCYQNMFRNCSSLVTAPALPATTLAKDCYRFMFSECTALVSAPALPATTLAQSCYQSMFASCRALVKAPEIKATSFATPSGTAANNMFSGCYSLNEITVYTTNWINQTNWVSGVAATGDFYNNGNAQSIPVGNNGIPTGWVEHVPQTIDYFYIETLEQRGRSTVLKHGTPTSGSDLSYSFDKEIWTPVTYDANNRFDIMVEAGEKLYLRSSTGLSESNSNWYYFGSDSHFNVGGDIRTLIDYTDSTLSTAPQYCFYKLFNSATNMISAANLDFSGFTTLTNSCCYQMFFSCSSLTTAPALPATTLANYCYGNMFSSCSSLTTAPALPATTLVNSCYYEMFKLCSSLTTAPALPATTLVNSCYYGMFERCSSLTTSPVISATNLVEYSCNFMFRNCVNLNKVTTYIQTWDTSGTAKWLNGVSSSGDFYNLGGATIPTGTNGIPTGWTEHTSL